MKRLWSGSEGGRTRTASFVRATLRSASEAGTCHEFPTGEAIRNHLLGLFQATA